MALSVNETHFYEDHWPKVGIGVMVFKDEKILLQERRGSHGHGELAFPGGHHEYMESFETCAKRETREEAGIEIKNVKFLFLANITYYAPKHYVHVGLVADWKSGKPRIMEPEKCGGWDWYDMDAVPKPYFKIIDLAFDAYKTGKTYYDS